MTWRRFGKSPFIENPRAFSNDDNEKNPMMPINNDDTVFKKDVLNSLKTWKSEQTTFAIVVDNLNNSSDYSIVSGKSKAVESGMRFIGINANKISSFYIFRKYQLKKQSFIIFDKFSWSSKHHRMSYSSKINRSIIVESST
jgi:hypothetical protein